jgi:hypothetical protein
MGSSTIVTLDVATRDSAIKRAGSEPLAMQQIQKRKLQAQARYDAQLAAATGTSVRALLILQQDGVTRRLAIIGESLQKDVAHVTA